MGVEDVMSSHGLTTPSLVAGRPAPPPQCLLNSGCLLVPVPSVPIPLRILLCPCHLSLGSHAAGYFTEPIGIQVHDDCCECR